MYNPYDYYFKEAKKQWYKARSAFKLDEIQNKFNILDKKTKTVLDIGCSPGSWLQYISQTLKNKKSKNFSIIWFDIQSTTVNLEWVKTYTQDISEHEPVKQILEQENIFPGQIDVIVSDMAPKTIWQKDIDAIRLFNIIDMAYRLYDEYLKPDWKFVIKVFMWPGFEELIKKMKDRFWWKNIKIFKPDASRKESKETYIIKYN